jgi:hypothetical protein
LRDAREKSPSGRFAMGTLARFRRASVRERRSAPAGMAQSEAEIDRDLGGVGSKQQ